MIGTFIFEEILCWWGAVEQLITNNGTPYIAALDWFADRYSIQHICISAYNSQANSIVEQQHHTVCKSIFKACNSDNSCWPTVAPFAFWADCATTCKSTGHSPCFMVHSVEPILSFDLAQATFLVSDLTKPLSTKDLLAVCACQLQKCSANLTAIHNCILASHHTSIR